MSRFAGKDLKSVDSLNQIDELDGVLTPPLRFPFRLCVDVIIFKCTRMLKFIAKDLGLEAALGEELRRQGHVLIRAGGGVSGDGRARPPAFSLTWAPRGLAHPSVGFTL